MKVGVFDLNRINLNGINLNGINLNRNEVDPQSLLFTQPFAYMDYLFPVAREVIWQSSMLIGILNRSSLLPLHKKSKRLKSKIPSVFS